MKYFIYFIREAHSNIKNLQEEINMNTNIFLEAVANRRSHYGINKEEIVSRDRIVEIVNEAVRHAPSAMNSQSARVVVLLGEQHDRLWEITRETLRKILPAGAFKSTDEKVDAFKAGYGTVLFYEDKAVVTGLEEQYALYKDNFQPWSYQSSGMLQFIVWTALSSEGLGASLQHYNPLIDDEVAETFGVDKNFKLIGQLVFGNPTSEASEKGSGNLESRITILQ